MVGFGVYMCFLKRGAVGPEGWLCLSIEEGSNKAEISQELIPFAVHPWSLWGGGDRVGP